MARVTKVQTYAIRWLNHENKKSEDIASELKLTINQVNSVLEKFQTSNTENNPVKTAQEPVSKVQKMLSKKINGNKTVTIMSQEASIAIQETPPKPNKRPSQESYIHKPN